MELTTKHWMDFEAKKWRQVVEEFITYIKKDKEIEFSLKVESQMRKFLFGAGQVYLAWLVGIEKDKSGDEIANLVTDRIKTYIKNENTIRPII